MPVLRDLSSSMIVMRLIAYTSNGLCFLIIFIVKSSIVVSDTNISNHLKEAQRLLNCFYFLISTPRLPAVLGLWLVIILPLCDPVLPLYLGYIQIRHMEAILLLHPLLDLLIGRFALSSTHIHLFHIELHGDMILRFGKFGQKAYRLIDCRLR